MNTVLIRLLEHSAKLGAAITVCSWLASTIPSDGLFSLNLEGKRLVFRADPARLLRRQCL